MAELALIGFWKFLSLTLEMWNNKPFLAKVEGNVYKIYLIKPRFDFKNAKYWLKEF